MQRYKEIDLDQSSDFEVLIEVDRIEEANGNYSGYVVSSQMRKSPYSETFYEFTANYDVSTTEYKSIVKLSMDSANTSNIFPGRYLFDVVSTSEENKKTKVAYGVVDVYSTVTR